MKRKVPFKVDIPVPCTESWDDMTPMDKGRYCGQCSKKIIDFTKLADHEVARMFLDSRGPVCGRFSESQLNRDLLFMEKERANAIVPALLVSTALAAGIASNAVANQHQVDITPQVEQRDTTGVPAGSKVSNSDTTGMPAAESRIQRPDLSENDQDVVVTNLHIKFEHPIVFTGYTVTTLPRTKRGIRKAERRHRKAFSKAVRSKPVHIKTQLPADEAKK
ncbi:hypothetical protein [Chitinophaga filiformis]|uniref:Uncharacterized protein n=1 Tax=Chitinophaga filiformis TaxID=104663 RepID=A0A1G7INC4_CHIFI|nr:hypothetical protein [Chitinophaga filiformis]SDF14046.1 hypothetical protein SAMN04488121_101913 [Chitinophaga filiformis]